MSITILPKDQLRKLNPLEKLIADKLVLNNQNCYKLPKVRKNQCPIKFKKIDYRKTQFFRNYTNARIMAEWNSHSNEIAYNLKGRPLMEFPKCNLIENILSSVNQQTKMMPDFERKLFNLHKELQKQKKSNKPIQNSPNEDFQIENLNLNSNQKNRINSLQEEKLDITSLLNNYPSSLEILQTYIKSEEIKKYNTELQSKIKSKQKKSNIILVKNPILEEIKNATIKIKSDINRRCKQKYSKFNSKSTKLPKIVANLDKVLTAIYPDQSELTNIKKEQGDENYHSQLR